MQPPSSERGQVANDLIPSVIKAKRTTRRKTKATGGHVEVKAFIDCGSSGRLTAAAEVECADSHASAQVKGAKEL